MAGSNLNSDTMQQGQLYYYLYDVSEVSDSLINYKKTTKNVFYIYMLPNIPFLIMKFFDFRSI